MNRWIRALSLFGLAASALAAQAQTTPQTYANLSFTFSTTVSGYSACNELRLDATGDFVRSTKFVLYGALNCPTTATAYTAAGSGYTGFDGSINMAFILGSGISLQCVRIVNLAGSCDVNNAAGVKVGTASIALK